MPQAIPLIAYAAATAAEFTAVQVAVAVVASSVAVGAYERNQARAQARDAYNASLTDRTIVINSAVSPRRLALGRVRLGGNRVYADTVGTNQRLLDQAVAMCEGPIDAVEGFWVGDEWIPIANIVSQRPTSGKYATASTKSVTTENRSLAGVSSFTLTNAPVSAADVTVSLDQGGDLGYTTLTVSSVVGTTVNLSAAATGNVVVDYAYYGGDAPLLLQYVLGDQTAATSWTGVTTPKALSTDVRNGVAYYRALMGWDENIYQTGPASISALVRGARDVYDPRLNLCPTPGLTGAVAGTPGTAPTGTSINLGAGISRQIVGSGTDAATGLPYLDLRLYGTPTTTTVVNFPFGASTSAPAATPGQAWAGRVGLRLLALSGALTALRLQLLSYDSSLVVSTEAIGASVDMVTLGSTQWATVSDASASATTTRILTRLNVTAAAGVAMDVTMRILLPQLWQGTLGDASDPVKWTSNPALLSAWYRTRPRILGGMGTPWHRIDWATVMTAASICDETINVRKRDGSAGYELVKRYECHTVLQMDAAPADNLEVILSSMLGSFPFTGGLYRCYAGAHRAPTITLTDANIAAGQPIRIIPSTTGMDTVPNTVTARFVDLYQGYVETSAKPVANATYVAADGYEEAADLTLSASTDERQANYLMGVMLERKRPGFAAELTVTGVGADMALLDGVSLNLTGYSAFTSMTWEIRKRVNNFDGTYTLTLQQTKSWIWSLDADRYTPTNPPGTPDLSYLWKVTAPTGFTVALPTPARLPDGTTLLRAACSWNAPAQAYVQQSGRIEIQTRDIAATTWSGGALVSAADRSTVISLAAKDRTRSVFRARYVNGMGCYSDWVLGKVDVVGGQLIERQTVTVTGVAITAAAHTPDGEAWRTKVVEIVYTPAINCIAVLTASGSGTYTTSASWDMGEFNAGIYLAGEYTTGGVQKDTCSQFGRPGFSSSFNFTVSGTRTFALTAGTTYTFRYLAKKFADTCTVNYAEMRLEAYK